MEIENLVRESHPQLLELGGINTSCGDSHAALREIYRERLPSTVIDKVTLEQIELKHLFDAVNHTETMVGAASLLTSLSQPLTSLELIRAKQESLREIDVNDQLRQRLEDFVQAYKRGDMQEEKGKLGKFWDIIRYGNDVRGEEALFSFLNQKWKKYDGFRSMKKTGRTINEAAKILPEAETPYLSTLVQEIQGWEGTTISNMMDSTSYRSLKGPLIGKEAKIYTPRLPFRPTYATMFIWWPAIVGAGMAIAEYGLGTPMGGKLSTINTLGTLGQLQLIWGLVGGRLKTQTDIMFIRKLAGRANQDENFNQALSSIGRIDELLSFHKYAKEVGYDTCLPTVEEREKHAFTAQDLRNPILAKTMEGEVVGNDLTLEGNYVTVLTGPNSVGKTTLCKSVIQNQVLGQAGGYVTASQARMSIADYFAYQYYAPDKLDEEHGDFGVNMARTKEIFEYTTPRSLVVLNTLASGTTFEEELEHSDNVLRGLNTIGNNTLLVTHNHALADQLQGKGIGQFLMGEYKDGSYTRKFIPGISRNSGSHIVAEKLGFTEKDIQAHLKKKGYLQPTAIYKAS